MQERDRFLLILDCPCRVAGEVVRKSEGLDEIGVHEISHLYGHDYDKIDGSLIPLNTSELVWNRLDNSIIDALFADPDQLLDLLLLR